MWYGAALIVANHGGALAIDGLMLKHAVSATAGRPLEVLGADFLFNPVTAQSMHALGVHRASREVARVLLDSGSLVGVWPEGVRGVGKTLDQRYRLQKFGRGGFAAVAREAGVPIIPAAIIGAEEAFPLVAKLSGFSGILGVPYIPVTPTFPSLGPLGLIPLPSRWSISFGAPIDTSGQSTAVNNFELADLVKAEVHELLMTGLSRRTTVF